jgi:hypothetical protein
MTHSLKKVRIVEGDDCFCDPSVRVESSSKTDKPSSPRSRSEPKSKSSVRKSSSKDFVSVHEPIESFGWSQPKQPPSNYSLLPNNFVFQPSIVSEKNLSAARQDILVLVWQGLNRLVERFCFSPINFSLITESTEMMQLVTQKFSQAIFLYQRSHHSTGNKLCDTDPNLQAFLDQVLICAIQDHINDRLHQLYSHKNEMKQSSFSFSSGIANSCFESRNAELPVCDTLSTTTSDGITTLFCPASEKDTLIPNSTLMHSDTEEELANEFTNFIEIFSVDECESNPTTSTF